MTKIGWGRGEMTPSQATAAITRDPKRGEITTATGKNQAESILNHAASRTIYFVLEEVKLLRIENESLRGDVNFLKRDVNILKRQEEPSARNDLTTVSSNHFASDEASEVAPPPPEGADMTIKKKNKKNRKKKRGGEVANYFGAAGRSLTRIAAGVWTRKVAVGFVSIALLVSVVLGKGMLAKGSPFFWEQKGSRTDGRNMDDKAVDSAAERGDKVMAPVKVPLPNHQHSQSVMGEEPHSQGEQKQKGGHATFQKKIGAVINSSNMHDVGALLRRVSVDSRPMDQSSGGIMGKTSPSILKRSVIESRTPQKIGKTISVKMNGFKADFRIPEQLGSANSAKEAVYAAVGAVAGETSSHISKSGTSKISFPQERPNHLIDSQKITTGDGEFHNERENTKIDEPSSIVQETTVIALYYPNSAVGHCNNDPTQQPVYDKMILYKTAKECCEAEFPKANGAGLRNSFMSCMESSPPPPPPRSTNTGISTSTKITSPPITPSTASLLTPPSFQSIALEKTDEASHSPINPWPTYSPTVSTIPTSSPTVSAIPTSSTGPTESPSSSSIPSSSSSPTKVCRLADKDQCGCKVLFQADYTGSISTTENGLECWDWADSREDYSLDGVNYCRNPINDPSGTWCITGYAWEVPNFHSCNVPNCDECSCMPPCGQPNDAACGCPSIFQADECCEEYDASCKCDYLKVACRKSLENNSTDFCDDAEVACCKGKYAASCKCNMYEEICADSPGKSTCDVAAENCCPVSYKAEREQCVCDFYTYAANANVPSYESDVWSVQCDEAGIQQATSRAKEKRNLKQFYKDTGGDYWLHKTGWLDDEVFHCNWFGITCNDNNLTIEMNLRSNNISGTDLLFPRLTELQTLDLARNNLQGKFQYGRVFSLRHLARVDISENYFSGHVDMTFPAASYINFSNNKFTSVSFRRFNLAHENLQAVDLSNNHLDQDVSDIFINVPPNLDKLILSNNALKGDLPNPFPLENVEFFAIANNAIIGPLPEFRSTLLKVLDMSNQKQTEGLSGTIPAAFSKLEDCSYLNLAGNSLSGDIPSTLGSMKQLKVFNISSNLLEGSIPSELGKLADTLKALDLSMNKLTGMIPKEMANLRHAAIYLSGNSILDPAPLDLCFHNSFDLMNDTGFCPPERNALKEFYISAKGIEWTESAFWLDPYASFCDWYGVTCSEANMTNNTIKLELKHNGLSGKLSKKIASLTFLKVLDLCDNDIKGTIPTEIANLTNLEYLRLCYNNFIGNETNFGHLQHLKLIQLHGNRLSGTVPELNLPFSGNSSFVADCGNPSDFDKSLVCDECTMCCNSQQDCHHVKEIGIQNAEMNCVEFAGVFCSCIFVASLVLAVAVNAYGRHKGRNTPESSIHHTILTNKVKMHALRMIGNDSVYQFLLGKSWSGWSIALATMTTQILMLFVFVGGADIDSTNDKTELVYTWKCPRDQDQCRDTTDLDWRGWLSFIVLMAAYLLKDIIKGVKMIVLSAKEIQPPRTRIRYFVGGMLLTTVTLLTLYVSAIYNAATATSNTLIIANSVIILLICEIDELFHAILVTVDEDWVKGLSRDEEQREGQEPAVATLGRSETDDEEDGLGAYSRLESNSNVALPRESVPIQNLEDEVRSLKVEVQTLKDTMLQQSEELSKLLAMNKQEHAEKHELA